MKLVDKIVQREPRPNKEISPGKRCTEERDAPAALRRRFGQNQLERTQQTDAIERGLYASSGHALESDSFSNLMKSYK
jgi:hypothetical protein